MKAVVAAFNQEKAVVGAFSVIVQPVVEPMEHYTALNISPPPESVVLGGHLVVLVLLLLEVLQPLLLGHQLLLLRLDLLLLAGRHLPQLGKHKVVIISVQL